MYFDFRIIIKYLDENGKECYGAVNKNHIELDECVLTQKISRTSLNFIVEDNRKDFKIYYVDRLQILGYDPELGRVESRVVQFKKIKMHKRKFIKI